MSVSRSNSAIKNAASVIMNMLYRSAGITVTTVGVVSMNNVAVTGISVSMLHKLTVTVYHTVNMLGRPTGRINYVARGSTFSCIFIPSSEQIDVIGIAPLVYLTVFGIGRRTVGS